jgi:hypothetical protein
VSSSVVVVENTGFAFNTVLAPPTSVLVEIKPHQISYRCPRLKVEKPQLFAQSLGKVHWPSFLSSTVAEKVCFSS